MDAYRRFPYPQKKPKTKGCMMPRKKSSTIVDQLRQAIADSRETEYMIAKMSGVSQSVVNRFVHGERGIGLETAAKLCRLPQAESETVTHLLGEAGEGGEGELLGWSGYSRRDCLASPPHFSSTYLPSNRSAVSSFGRFR